MKVFNLHGDEWDRTEEREGWHSRDAWVGRRIGAELLGATLYELDPGNRLCPYHLHYANEEWLLVLCGAPTLRTPEGEQALGEGDAPEIVEQVDSGKIGARSVEGEQVLLTRPGPLLDYWDGEE